MSHKTSPVAPGRQIVARRKGGKVRLFDTARATMGKWTTDPQNTKARAEALNKAAAKIDAQQRETVTAAAYESMTVPALRKILEGQFGLKPTTRTKKDALVHTLVELSTHK